MFVSSWMLNNNPTRQSQADKIQSLLQAFVSQGRSPEMYEKCPVWMDDGGNLWFQSTERKNPSLLAVWGRDDVINVRKSGSEGKQVGVNGHDWVVRKALREEIEKLAAKAGYKADQVFKLTERKAEEAMFNRLTKGI